jgi:hypothetical protein
MEAPLAEAEATVSRRSDPFSKVNELSLRCELLDPGEFVAISGQVKAFRLAGLQAARELTKGLE